jgi:ABC-type antimicrobial peptide transport system permease subunit
MRTFGISQPLTREVFEPMTAPWSYTALVIRETKPGSISFRQIQEAISKALPGAQLIDFQSLQDRFETELKVPRKRLFLLGSFSSIAAMVAIFGLCSVLFAVIKERDMEIGIRLALGADSPAIARALLTSILPWIFLGGIAGVVLSLFVSDPFHFDARVPAWQMAAAQMQILLVLGALVAVSLWIPLRRAFQRPVSDLLRTL